MAKLASEARGTAQVSIRTAKVHTIEVSMPEVSQTRDIGPEDEVRVVLTTREGTSSVKRLTYRDIAALFPRPVFD